MHIHIMHQGTQWYIYNKQNISRNKFHGKGWTVTLRLTPSGTQLCVCVGGSLDNVLRNTTYLLLKQNLSLT